MRLFDIQNGKIVLDPNVLGIKEFKDLWDRDKTLSKKRATNDISYVAFLCDNTSSNPYRGFIREERAKVLGKDIYGKSNFKPDIKIKKAIEKYEDLQSTTHSKLLNSARKAADKLAQYFEEVDFTKTDDNGKLLYSAREVAQNLSNVGNIVTSLTKLEDLVRKEQLEESRARGDTEIGYFEVKRKEFEYGGK